MGLLTVFSAKGGCGASLIATNLAVALSRLAPTLLVDLHGPEGADDLLLDLHCARAWPELLPVAGELTDRQIGLVACHHAGGLAFLGAPDVLVDDPIQDARVRVLLDALSRRYAWVIVDASSGGWNPIAAELSATVLLVTTADPPALRCTKRLLQLRTRRAQGRVGLVLNQVSRGQPASASEIAGSLDCPLLAVAPVDPRGVGYQVNFGRPCALDDHSALGRVMSGLARRISAAAVREQQMPAASAYAPPPEDSR